MSGAAILCAILSLLSGLLGFKFASQSDVANLPAYIASLSISYVIGLVCTMIAIRGKSRYTVLAARDFHHIDLSTRTALAIATSMLISVAVAIVSFFTSGLSLAALVFLQGAMISAQFLTFDISNLNQIIDNGRFWRIQTIGAAMRGVLIAVGFVLVGPNFYILALSGVAAALAIAVCYRVHPRHLVRRHLTWRILMFRFRHTLSRDALLRSTRTGSEPLMVTTTALVVQRFAPAGAGEAALLAAPYLNAAFASFHQVFNRLEVSMLRGMQTRKRMTAVTVALIFCAMLAYPTLRWFPPAAAILPHPTQASAEEFSIVLAAACFTLPLSLGYGMADMFPLKDLTRVMLFTVSTWVGAMALTLSIGQVEPAAFLVLMALPALSIGVGLGSSFFDRRTRE